MKVRDIVLSTRDAAVLHGLVERAARSAIFDEAVEDLAASLEFADVVPSERRPVTVVALDSAVEYVELPDGPSRTVVVAHPAKADVARGRVSVLSPVGRALLGRRVGNVLTLDLPTGERRRIKVTRVERGGSDE